MSIESVMPSNQCILCHLLFLLPSIFCKPVIFKEGMELLCFEEKGLGWARESTAGWPEGHMEPQRQLLDLEPT